MWRFWQKSKMMREDEVRGQHEVNWTPLPPRAFGFSGDFVMRAA
jgi:hypothetical protein